MSKPIRATPQLSGPESRLFFDKMVQNNNQKVTKKSKKLVEEILTSFSY